MLPGDHSRRPPDDGHDAGVPGRLCRVAVRLLPVTGASASLRDGDGLPVRLCASNDRASYLAEVQATLGDGPCVLAAATGAPVLAGDLRSGADAERWPLFAQEATAVGVSAVHALPLGSDTVCVGTLDLYRDTPGGLTGPELNTARLLAGVMTTALMALPPEGEDDDGDGEVAWPSGLTDDHDEVHQAVGMIMAQLGVGSDEALARLRGAAFARGRTARDVAHDVLTHRHRFDRDD
ncbi:GAF and ANTAR domain-containing protein [Streptomyces sp. JHA26]|uniref:GAF and ANTAR domain-containing protein n=1 Tax=Streptomyces sp. JHA26 TaxID=1917143 RepID=UPI00209B803D|nr:GAF and ANTAR domain-containing protein [Streptomyces sp. JHA26]